MRKCAFSLALLALLVAGQAAAIALPQRVILLGGYAHDSDADAYLAQLAKNGCTSPTLRFRRAVTTYFQAEKRASNFGNQDAQYLGSAPDSCTAGTNLAQPTLYKITWNGTLTFSFANCINGDGSTGYGDTGVAENALTKLSQNNAHVEVWTAANKANAIGLLNLGTTLSITPITNKSTKLNGVTIIDTGGGLLGLHAADRGNSTNASTYLNGAVQSNAAANTSTAPAAADIVLCRINASMCAGSINLCFAGFGGAMNDEAAHYANVRALLIGLGVTGI